MAHYIVLMKFTDQGARTIKDTTKRADAAKETAAAAGITMKDIYWTQGGYDVVATFEASDETALMAYTASVAKAGNVRTQTLRAFTAAEFGKVLAKVT